MRMFLRSLAATALLLAAAAAPAQSVLGVTEVTPYSYLRNGQVAGPATEVVEATLREAGLAHRIAVYPWARAYELALTEPDVLIFLLARTPAREALFKWTGEFMKMEYHLYKLKSRQDVVVRSLDDARRYAIGVVRDDVRHQYLKAKGFHRLVVSGEAMDNFRRLVNGQVQLSPVPTLDMAVLCREARFDCSQLEPVYTLDELSVDLYMAYSTATPETTVARTKAAFERLRANGTVKRLMAPVTPP